jgi:FkbM family methyltransferase
MRRPLSSVDGSGISRRVKRALRAMLPRPVAYASYVKALFENEIELRLLSQLCDRRLVAIDVGAFTGTYTIGAALHSLSVVAVEPQRQQAAELQRAMPRNVRVVEAALSSRSGRGVLHMPSMDGSSMSRLDAQPAITDGWLDVTVELMRMDDLDATPVGFVKIDAEGHELDVLAGASRLLRADRPVFVIEAEERHAPGAVQRLSELFERASYDGFFVWRGEVRAIGDFDATVHQDLRLLIGGPRRRYADYINNFIFVPRDRAATLPRRVPSAWRSLYDAAGACCRRLVS